jgi:hypothetical protein
LSLSIRLLEPVTAFAAIAAYLPTNRALANPYDLGDTFLSTSLFSQRMYLAAVFMGYVSKLPHQ